MVNYLGGWLPRWLQGMRVAWCNVLQGRVRISDVVEFGDETRCDAAVAE